MTFIITFTVLLIERFFDCSHLRKWQGYNYWQGMVAKRFSGQSPYLILALIILPLLASVFLIQLLLQPILFGFIGFIFQIALLVYCLGPNNLWADTYICLNTLMQGDTESLKQQLKTSFQLKTIDTDKSLQQQFLKNIFIAANDRIVAVLFWFILLGPMGALLYRVITLAAASPAALSVKPEFIHASRFTLSLLDWIPIRIFTSIFALSGHFVKVVSCWRKKAVLGVDVNQQLLVDCGQAALGIDSQTFTSQEMGTEKNVIGLLDRSFIITLTLIAIFTLII